MTKRRAVYAGSFDPPTNGHLWTITQAARIFDEVIVAVAVNPDKKPTFLVEDRMTMLESIVAPLENVRVESFTNQYTVDYAASIDASFLVRGQRNTNDFVGEFGMRQINADMGNDIVTVFLIPPRELAEVSSSLVKGLIGPQGWERVVAKYVPPVVLRQLIGLKHQVWEHLRELTGATCGKFEFWDAVLKPYMNPDRHYHDWRHIVEMLNLFNEVRDETTDAKAIELAILFHDFVYDTQSKTNELDSVRAMATFLETRWVFDKSFVEYVAGLILVTRHDPTAPPQTGDEKIIVDLDLAILGADPKRFDEYEAGIRAEYAHVPSNDFAEGRIKILQGFLMRGRIYYTDYFHEKFGARAEENLKRSITKLFDTTNDV